MRILYVTSEWPTKSHDWAAPFLVRQVNALRAQGIAVDVFAFRGHRKIRNYFQIYRQLHTRLGDESYDVIHAHFGHSGLLASFPKKLPLVVTFHGSDLQGIYTQKGHYHPISYPLRVAMQWVAFVADEVVLVSEHLRHFILRKDCHIIPGGIDLTLFNPMPQFQARQSLNLTTERPIVAFIGSPNNPVKRYWLAKKVIGELPRELNTEMLTITGIVPEKMPLFLNAVDALLLTSKHEGSPTVIKEAMACNLPVVTLDVGDVRERLAKVTGCAIVTDEKPAVIAQHLANILRLRQRTNGWEIAQQLDENSLVLQQIGVYEKAIK